MWNNGRWRWTILALVILAICIGVWAFVKRSSAEISLGDLAAQISHNEVKHVAIRGDDLTIVYKDAQRPEAHSKKEPGVGIFDTLRSFGLTVEQLQEANITVASDLPWPAISVSLPLILLVLLFIWMIYAISSTTLPTSQQFPTPTIIDRQPKHVQTTLDDLGGMKDATTALQPVLTWLANPTDTLGIDVPRGILIVGPSGVGKTLLAESLAGQTARTLFVYNGAEFTELLVGMGSTRMRAAFAQARQHAAEHNTPVIVFIDQLDMIAAERSVALPAMFGSASEDAKTLVTLLAELDDLRANRRIYVVAATSRPRVIDPAILGPGRLSLRINLALPNESARKEILAKLTANMMLHGNAKDLLAEIARGTKTFSAAELVQLVRWAHEASQTHAGSAITKDDFVQAKARLLPQPKEQTPEQIYKHLKQRVTGQKAAKKRLAVAISNHYLRLREATRFDARSTEIKKANVLMIGPTGSGKTMLIEEIASYLQVPYVIFNATILTETGYTGASVEQMLSKLLSAADQHLRRAEFGIICIDEIDKLAFHQGERSRHAGGIVQQELLKLVEGTIIDVPKGNGERTPGTETYQFDTSNVLFVCLGAFNGIENVVNHRLQTSLHTGKPRHDLISQVQPEDIINYGFLPELIGRFPIVTFTKPLTVEEIVAILNNQANGLRTGYERLLQIQGYEPNFDDKKAIELIAHEAVRRRVGARGLGAIMEEILLDPMFNRPSTFNQPLLINEEFVKKSLGAGKKHDPDIPTIKEIKDVLTQLGQNGHRYAKEILALTSWEHYRGRGSAEAKGSENTPSPSNSNLKRQAVLLVDPFTRQRGRLVEQLAKIWQVPLAVMQADQLERSLNGRSGSAGWLNRAVQILLEQCDYDVARAQRGILFIDNFDLTLERVTVDPFYNVLSQQIIELLRGRALPLQTADGQTTTFETEQLFIIFGGDFHFTTSLTTSFGKDPSQLDRYKSGQLLDTLREEFRLSSELLEYLYVAPLDLMVTEADLQYLIKGQDERLQQKYQPLLKLHDIPPGLTQEEYAQLASKALKEQWPITEIGIKLERMLLEKMHSNGVSHDNP